jgi:hypothetical protein
MHHKNKWSRSRPWKQQVKSGDEGCLKQNEDEEGNDREASAANWVKELSSLKECPQLQTNESQTRRDNDPLKPPGIPMACDTGEKRES